MTIKSPFLLRNLCSAVKIRNLVTVILVVVIAPTYRSYMSVGAELRYRFNTRENYKIQISSSRYEQTPIPFLFPIRQPCKLHAVWDLQFGSVRRLSMPW